MSIAGLSSFSSRDASQQIAARDDYRRMTDAVRAGDLDQARRAYDRVMSRFGPGATVAANSNEDPLAAIGAALSEGDLGTANQALDGLEQRALRVLRAARQGSEAAAPEERPRNGATLRITV